MPASQVAEALAVNGGQPVSSVPVPFMSPALKPQDIEAAHDVLMSGMLRAASRCAEFETRFAQASQAKHALTCANGTCALQLAYGALFEPGWDVLVPAWTFLATASMIVAAGCNPIFCDVRGDTFQIDIEDAARRITPNTRAIAVTHLYGMPVDIDAVEVLAARHKLRVVYDAAQSHLATYKGKGIGAFGDVVTYSFYATKNLGTGEGGMVTCNDDAIAHKLAMLRSHGETGKYLHESIGFNYRMNDITGAIGLSRLGRLAEETQLRRKAADTYDQIISGIDGLEPPTRTPGADGVWHLYTVKMDLSKFSCTRDEFCDALKCEGVPTAVHYPRSLTAQPCFKPYVKDHPPVARDLATRVFCLPMHHDLTPQHFDIVAEALRKVAGALRS